MEHIELDIQGVPETMLQTLYARAKESRSPRHCIRDPKAEELVEELHYDFSLADKDWAMSSGVIARTILLDRLTEDFLAANPGAVVVNIACGLDTRCYRVPEGSFRRWYNLDLPEVIDIRRRLLPENGPVYQIARSAMDESWAGEVLQEDEPVLVIVEGLTMYLSEAEVKRIFSVIAGRFARATVYVEAMSPLVVGRFKEKSIEGSQAKFTWGIRNDRELAALLPDFRGAESVSLMEGMRVFIPAYRVLGRISFLRNLSNKILILERE